MPSEWREQHGYGQAECEEQHADLVQQTQADDHAEKAPESHIVAADEAGHDERPESPEDEIEGVHRVKPGESKVLRRDGYRQPGERLGEATAIHFTSQARRQPYEQSAEQRGNDAQR